MDEYNEFLAHHGIKGQKWGIRRYQNMDGSLTTEGKRRRGQSDKSTIKNLVDKHKTKLAEKKAADEQTKHENLKRYVKNHPTKLYKHRDEFSKEEIDDIVKTIKVNRALKDIRDEEIARGWKKVQTISDNLGKVKTLAEHAKGLYNLSVELNNTLVDTGAHTNGKIKTKIGEKPRETKKDTSWYDDLLQKGDYDTLYKNVNNLTTSQIDDITKRIGATRKFENLIEPKNKYKGKHEAKHALDISVGDIIFDESDDEYLAHHGILGMKYSNS